MSLTRVTYEQEFLWVDYLWPSRAPGAERWGAMPLPDLSSPPQGQQLAHTWVWSASEPQSGVYVLKGPKPIKREHFMTYEKQMKFKLSV